MMKLNQANLGQLPATVTRPAYDPGQLRQGIVHIGVYSRSAMRTALAAYTDALMNLGEGLDWAICGAGLRSEDRTMRDALAAQDHLYTLFELGDQPDTEVRVIAALNGMLLAEDGAGALLAKLAEPAIRIVSLTITEGGYYIDPASQRFDPKHPDIVRDAADFTTPRTVFGLILAAIKRRRREVSSSHHNPDFHA